MKHSSQITADGGKDLNSTKNTRLDGNSVGDLTRYIKVFKPNYKRNEEPI